VKDFDFINFDDPLYVTDNKNVLPGINKDSIIWAFSFEDKDGTYWHPLSWLSHMLDVQLYGLNPGQHHLTNVIFHILNAVLLFLVLYRMTGAIWRSAFVAALFAVHPINVESVAWVAERKNVLSTFFCMLTLMTYVFYSERPGIVRYVLMFFCFAMGLLAKPMLVTLPFVLLLLDNWPLGRMKLIEQGSHLWHILSYLILEKIPLFLLSGLSIYLASASLKGFGNYVSLQSASLSLRIGNALVSYAKYISQLFWPHNLAVLYPFPKIVPIYQSLGTFLLLFCITILIIAANKKYGYLILGWFWFLGTLVPVIGLIQAGLWPAQADRWAYVPMIGLFITISWGLSDLLRKYGTKKSGFMFGMLIIVCTLLVLSRNQVRYWKNSVALFKHVIEVTENNYIAHNNLGYDLLSRGKTTEAINHFKQSLKINENYGPAHASMGAALFKQKRFEEALQFFMNAEKIMPDDATVCYHLGKTLYRLDELDTAVEKFQQAIRIDPTSAEAYKNLGNALFRLGKNDKALASYQQAITIDPAYAQAYKSLGEFWYHNDQVEKALPNFIKAIKINSQFAEAYNGAGAALILMGEPRKAAAFFREAVKIDPDYVAAQNNLKNTLAALGKNK
jgi:tetratricopeptide (TPR) repeat protein